MKDITNLKEEVARKFGRDIESPSNFDALSLEIKRDTGEDVSVSTLKRIWGYVKYEHHPRNEILSIIAKYVGYKDWKDFVESTDLNDTSDFLNKDVVESKSLSKGAIVHIAWAPNRECELEYIGNSCFKILSARNSKIREGDTFICHLIAKGEPLMCSEVVRDGKEIAECYVAAKIRGLHSVKVKSS